MVEHFGYTVVLNNQYIKYFGLKKIVRQLIYIIIIRVQSDEKNIELRIFKV